ncbi:unnamed protein product [Penicillium camemberti]|uniref:Str. FM013 n=1 Tax=Penicillium camemberti (strain FM 013) TaxID=1429867 RepID=A0A0G4PBC2_PENC3|nr:unnamed protein product [Penicillium camemberti]
MIDGSPQTRELAGQPFVLPDGDTQAVRECLHPSVNSFLGLTYSPEPGFFYWVNDISMEVVDGFFPDLDAVSIPECCIHSVLTRVQTPRFKAIAPGLEVPHDTVAFTTR